MEFSIDKFNEIKHEAEDFYNGILHVYCPYFSDKIIFNNKGWDHLIFKRWNKTRGIEDQFARIRHIKVAPEAIKLSKTVQGIWKTNKMERMRKNDGGRHQVMKMVTYYEFISVLESHGSKIRFRVIIKQIEDGERFFYSLIPFWGTDEKGNRLIHSGDPEND